MTDTPSPIPQPPKQRQSREEILYDYFLEHAQEIMGGLDRLQEKHRELRGNFSEQRALLDKTVRDIQQFSNNILEQQKELEQSAKDSRLLFAKNFSEYCSDLSAKIVRSAVLGALGGGIMGGLIILGAWFITHR
ncbi:hypothetical protein [Acetobacter persici]|uniref:hypothetical protein n=1 Tax=Acetobacter persici TaxID=1076596 RepID=UPI001BADB9D5|nr:hypothetical protein [Acetobacter persici]MBS1017026.1 hypothetical protein [Acetobacter persici]